MWSIIYHENEMSKIITYHPFQILIILFLFLLMKIQKIKTHIVIFNVLVILISQILCKSNQKE